MAPKRKSQTPTKAKASPQTAERKKRAKVDGAGSISKYMRKGRDLASQLETAASSSTSPPEPKAEPAVQAEPVAQAGSAAQAAKRPLSASC